jgi:hypothetical protein
MLEARLPAILSPLTPARRALLEVSMVASVAGEIEVRRADQSPIPILPCPRQCSLVLLYQGKLPRSCHPIG